MQLDSSVLCPLLSSSLPSVCGILMPSLPPCGLRAVEPHPWKRQWWWQRSCRELLKCYRRWGSKLESFLVAACFFHIKLAALCGGAGYTQEKENLTKVPVFCSSFEHLLINFPYPEIFKNIHALSSSDFFFLIYFFKLMMRWVGLLHCHLMTYYQCDCWMKSMFKCVKSQWKQLVWADLKREFDLQNSLSFWDF